MKQHLLFATIITLLVIGCSKSTTGGGTSYDFTASSSASLKLKSRDAMSVGFNLLSSAPTAVQIPNMKSLQSTGPTLCSSTICFTPSALTGKYYGTGFLIQSSGNGMVAYFGQSNWSDIVGTSTSYRSLTDTVSFFSLQQTSI